MGVFSVAKSFSNYANISAIVKMLALCFYYVTRSILLSFSIRNL